MPLLKIQDIAKKVNIPLEYVEPYGFYKAKINLDISSLLKDKKEGNLVLVTAITPTKAGEGKTTTSIALSEGLAKIGQNVVLALREPSLGPVFGIKGGATGGGLASIEPKDDINLHFTGDMHALTSSVNLISAIIDNHIYQGNELHINPNKIVWKRCLDMNDRALREVEVGLGDKNGTPRKDGFVITVASELMAILCLSKDPDDFQQRINKIIVAYNDDDQPVCLSDLHISHAIMKLMKDAFKPNLVQTVENNPVLVHGGPFANIAHGCNSLIALKMALKLGDIVVTEAGFGADLGAEKFFDIACPTGQLTPDGAVVVATIRALKMHGGVNLADLEKPNIDALIKGAENLRVHVDNVKKFGVPVVVAINHFAFDSPEETKALTLWCEQQGYPVSFLDGYSKGGEGSLELAKSVVNMLKNEKSHYHKLYDEKLPIKDKIQIICTEIYRAGEILYTDLANSQIQKYEEMGYGQLPICMAKTPQSLTDNPKIVGAPSGYTITIREVNLSAGAGFIITLTGKILTMPGLPKIPAAVKMEEEN